MLQCAEALGVTIVRIWGGKKGSAELSDDEFAAEKGMLVSLECHNNTVTDENITPNCAFGRQLTAQT